MNERANPFGDLGDFAPAQAKPKPDLAVIDQVAEENGFPSRKSSVAPAVQSIEALLPMASVDPVPVRKQRRHTTGRNKQVNLKASDSTIERLYRQADTRQVSLAELLEIAVDLLEKYPQ